MIEWRPDSDGNGGRATPAVYRARVGVFQLRVDDHTTAEEPHRHRWTVLVGDRMVAQGDARGEYGAKQAARTAVVRIIALAERQLYRRTRVEKQRRRST